MIFIVSSNIKGNEKILKQSHRLAKSELDLNSIGRLGKNSDRSTAGLESYYSRLLESLSEVDEFKPPVIKIKAIKADQLLKETPQPSSHLSDKVLNYQLQYKTHKTDCKLVCSILESTGFFFTNSHNWNVLWTGCIPQNYLYKNLNLYQKINHFPSTWEITRKDRLCINIENMQQRYGKEHFDFLPETYVMPQGYSGYSKRAQQDKSSVWILKPSCSSRGRGIYLVNGIENVNNDEPCIISKYISDPYLINGLKFDLRLYVLVTSFDPLRIYLYKEGLTRFASQKYETGCKDNKFIHLTNYSVNKKNQNFIQNTDAKADGIGHKWSLSALLKHLSERNVNTDDLLLKIYDLIIKTIISIENTVTESIKKLSLHRNNCFDLLGFDIIIDSSLKPWLLEVNLSPSLATDSPLDFHIKSNLITDTFNTIGVRIKPNRKTLFNSPYDRIVKSHSSSYKNTAENRPNRNSAKKIQEILKESIEEYQRRAGFLRIYPCRGGEFYDQFFRSPKYLNKVMHTVLFDESYDLSFLSNYLARSALGKFKDRQNSSFDIKNQIKKHEEPYKPRPTLSGKSSKSIKTQY
jgi:tubulin polyglutamylase TTLL5